MIDRSSPFSLFGSSLAVVTCNSQEAEAGFGAVALNVKRLLGREAYVEMFLAAGRQGDLADKYKGLPLRTRIELFVNQQFVALAFNDCNCNVTEQSWDCSGGFWCSELTGCGFSSLGCGILWQSSCNGYCLPPT